MVENWDCAIYVNHLSKTLMLKLAVMKYPLHIKFDINITVICSVSNIGAANY